MSELTSVLDAPAAVDVDALPAVEQLEFIAALAAGVHRLTATLTTAVRAAGKNDAGRPGPGHRARADRAGVRRWVTGIDPDGALDDAADTARRLTMPLVWTAGCPPVATSTRSARSICTPPWPR